MEPNINSNEDSLIEMYAALPQDVREAIFSVDVSNTIMAIGKKFGLTIDKIGELASDTGLVMLGALHPRSFIQTLEQDLAVDRNKATDIAKEINHEVFFPIRENLKKIHGINASDEVPSERETAKDDILRKIPEPPREEPAKINPLSINQTPPRIDDVEVVSPKPRPSPAPSSTLPPKPSALASSLQPPAPLLEKKIQEPTLTSVVPPEYPKELPPQSNVLDTTKKVILHSILRELKKDEPQTSRISEPPKETPKPPLSKPIPPSIPKAPMSPPDIIPRNVINPVGSHIEEPPSKYAGGTFLKPTQPNRLPMPESKPPIPEKETVLPPINLKKPQENRPPSQSSPKQSSGKDPYREPIE